MTDWFAVAGLVFVASITPGPNNMLALRAGIGGSLAARLQVIGGVQLGCIGLLTITWMGLGALIAEQPLLGPLITVAGCIYLCWMALPLIAASSTSSPDSPSQNIGLGSVAVLQLVNPKAWIMVTTTVAATGATYSAIIALTALTIACSTFSLAAWVFAGARLSAFLSAPGSRILVDRLMGLLLVGFAVLLAFDQLWPGR